MDRLRLRDMTEDDLPAVLALNNAAVPHVNRLDLADLRHLWREAALRRVAELDGATAGALLGFAPKADYDSPNFLWFRGRYDDFLYVDRIVVNAEQRGGGIGRAHYDDLFAWAPGRVARITCEVNSEPPNPQLLKFHEGFGFAAVGSQSTEGGRKTVLLLQRPLPMPRG